LYFYPKDFTALCTAEACSFRDAFDTFIDLGVDVVGISTDDLETHHRFKAAHHLPFELLSDPNSHVAKLYGAVIPVVGITRRKTFLLDKDLTVVAMFENMFSPDQHTRTMIERLKAGATASTLSA
jgi:peroxiredoxin Q/BCP